MSFICISIQARSFMELRKKVKRAERSADVIEIWLDHLDESVSPENIMRLTNKPLLVVNKSKKEGGRWRKNEKEKIKTLKKYLKAGVAYVDVCMETDPKLLKEILSARRKNTSIIFSHHNFTETPDADKLWRLAQTGYRKGADIVKIVTTARSKNDNLTTLQLLAKAQRNGQKQEKKLISFCMGDKGKLSRLLAPHFNSYMMYLALNDQSKTAPGQLTVQEYKKYNLISL